MAKCAKCDSLLTGITISSTTLSGINMKRLNGLIYACPHCGAAISAGIDPIALKADVVGELAKKMGRS